MGAGLEGPVSVAPLPCPGVSPRPCGKGRGGASGRAAGPAGGAGGRSSAGTGRSRRLARVRRAGRGCLVAAAAGVGARLAGGEVFGSHAGGV